MQRPSIPGVSPRTFELRFRSFSINGREFAFPCDERGHVEQNQLSARARSSYRSVCDSVGVDYYFPELRTCNSG